MTWRTYTYVRRSPDLISPLGSFTADLSSLEPSESLALLSLQTLNLSRNSLGDAGVLALCRGLGHFSRHCAGLRRTPALKNIILSGNKISDKGAQCIGRVNVHTLSSPP